MPRSAPVDGFSLAYDRSGRGSPVLLLHGWPGTRADFRALVPLLTDATEVVVPDPRGFGESDKHAVEPEGGYSAAGHVLLSWTATPMRSARTCVTSGATGPAPAFELTEADLDQLVERYAEPGALIASIGWYRAGSGTVAISLAERMPAPAERIAQSTRFLGPEHDPLFPREWGDRLGAYFSRVTVTPLPNTGHFSPLEAPQAFATAIRETLAGA